VPGSAPRLPQARESQVGPVAEQDVEELEWLDMMPEHDEAERQRRQRMRPTGRPEQRRDTCSE